MAFRCISVFALLTVIAPFQAQSPPQNGLAGRSLEELRNIEVTSVSKKAQRLGSLAASAYHRWQARSYYDLTRTIQIDSALSYTAAMIGLSIGVQDAFEANHVEYESARFHQISQVPRNFYGKLTWRL